MCEQSVNYVVLNCGGKLLNSFSSFLWSGLLGGAERKLDYLQEPLTWNLGKPFSTVCPATYLMRQDKYGTLYEKQCDIIYPLFSFRLAFTEHPFPRALGVRRLNITAQQKSEIHVLVDGWQKDKTCLE